MQTQSFRCNTDTTQKFSNTDFFGNVLCEVFITKNFDLLHIGFRVKLMPQHKPMIRYEEKRRKRMLLLHVFTPQKACYTQISTWILKRFTTEDSRKIVKNAFGMMRKFFNLLDSTNTCMKIPQMKADIARAFSCFYFLR